MQSSLPPYSAIGIFHTWDVVWEKNAGTFSSLAVFVKRLISLYISSRAKFHFLPGKNRFGNLVVEALEDPPEEEMTLIAVSGSMPALPQTATASVVAAAQHADRKLLAHLIMSPAPLGPMYMTLSGLPSVSRIGLQYSNVSFFPPTMMVSV